MSFTKFSYQDFTYFCRVTFLNINLNRSHVATSEAEILEFAKQLCSQLKISQVKYNPYKVNWADKVNGYEHTVKVRLADQCYFEPSLVTLEKEVQDQLSPDDWKALITTELCYTFSVKPRGHRQFVLRKALPVGLVFALLEALIFYFTLPYFFFTGEWFGPLLYLLIAISVIFFIPAVILGRLASPGDKRDRREADEAAAEIVGREKLLQALRTAEALDIQDPARAERLRSSKMNPFSERERINNLQGSDDRSNLAYVKTFFRASS
jgi:hypothetical protein